MYATPADAPIARSRVMTRNAKRKKKEGGTNTFLGYELLLTLIQQLIYRIQFRQR